MKVHALGRWPHLIEHLEAIHRWLPSDLRGEVMLRQPQPNSADVKHWSPDDVVMVAGFADVAATRGRRTIYVEHGAGQSYLGARGQTSSYYHGGEHPDNVIGYIGPRQDVIDSWGRPGFATGSPICDPYELFSPATQPTAAITFHWNAAPPHRVGVPEAGTAYEHFQPHLRRIVDHLNVNGWRVLGHYHPQFKHMSGRWALLGVEEVPDAKRIRTEAHLLIADNTSLMYEMMYLGRDVIALNAPEWRRDVEHGLRFWEWAPRVQADDADQLCDVITDIPRLRGRTSDLCDWKITSYVYGAAHSDGEDGRRAATWLTHFLHTI